MLLELVVCGVWSVIMVFVACEIGVRVGELFEKLEGEVNQFDWYRFPLKIQQMLPTVLIVAQEPVIVKCFGSIACTRQSFKKVYIYRAVLRRHLCHIIYLPLSFHFQVANNVYSYFMILHKLYN